jgi:hypothetical protein
MSREYGPLDRLLEFLVFAAIMYEILAAAWHRRKVRVRQRQIRGFLSRGQGLQAAVPGWTAPEEKAPSWLVDFKNWDRETHEFLERNSAEAAISFLHEAGSGVAPVGYSQVASSVRNQYTQLLGRLDNLKAIMEKSEAYF